MNGRNKKREMSLGKKTMGKTLEGKQEGKCREKKNWGKAEKRMRSEERHGAPDGRPVSCAD